MRSKGEVGKCCKEIEETLLGNQRINVVRERNRRRMSYRKTVFSNRLLNLYRLGITIESLFI